MTDIKLCAECEELRAKLQTARELLNLVKPIVAAKPKAPKTMIELTAYVQQEDMPRVESIHAFLAALKELGE